MDQINEHDIREGVPIPSVFTAEGYASLVERLMANLRMRPVPPIVKQSDWLFYERFQPIWAVLSGSSSPYSWTEEIGGSAGTWSAYVASGTSNAYEVNGTGSLDGKKVLLYPGYDASGADDWRFQYIGTTTNCSSGSITVHVNCNSVAIVGATVAITGPGGYSSSGTTNSFGSYTGYLTGYPPGVYTVVVSKTNYTTQTTTLTASCTANSVTVNLPGAVTTVSGNIQGCQTGIAGVTVTILQGMTSLGSTTTDSSGNYTLSVSGTGPLTGLTLKADLSPRFAIYTTTFDSYCNATITINATLTAGTGYHCACANHAVSNTLHWSPGGGMSAATLTWTGASWDGTGTYTGLAYDSCTSGSTTSTYTYTVFWSFTGTTMNGTINTCGPTSAFPGRTPVPDTPPTPGSAGLGGGYVITCTSLAFSATFAHQKPDATLISDFTFYTGTLTE